MTYAQLGALRADCYAVLATWLMLMISSVLMVLTFLFKLPLEALLFGSATGFLVSAVVHGVLAFSHRCPSCGKHPTVQGFAAPHPASVGQSELAGWAGVVVSVMRRHRFVCIHCGSEFDLDAKAS